MHAISSNVRHFRPNLKSNLSIQSDLGRSVVRCPFTLRLVGADFHRLNGFAD